MVLAVLHAPLVSRTARSAPVAILLRSRLTDTNSVSLWAGLRLLSVNTSKFTHDPTIAMWLFITLTQVQVMLALLGAAYQGLKQTLQDLKTRHQIPGDSRSGSRHDGSFVLRKLRLKRSPTQTGNTGNSSRVSRSKIQGTDIGDGDSQDGIIRQDEFEVRYDHGEAPERDPEGFSKSW